MRVLPKKQENIGSAPRPDGCSPALGAVQGQRAREAGRYAVSATVKDTGGLHLGDGEPGSDNTATP